jgi:hypothetical protein
LSSSGAEKVERGIGMLAMHLLEVLIVVVIAFYIYHRSTGRR